MPRRLACAGPAVCVLLAAACSGFASDDPLPERPGRFRGVPTSGPERPDRFRGVPTSGPEWPGRFRGVPTSVTDSIPPAPATLLRAEADDGRRSAQLGVRPEGGNTSVRTTVRAYLLDDLRIQWSGVEATFGVEGAVELDHSRPGPFGPLEVRGRFDLNSTWRQAVLAGDGTNRDDYLATFDVDPFYLANLYVTFETPGLTWQVGKFPSPAAAAFRKELGLGLFNSGLDAPFVHTEIVDRREIGVGLGKRHGSWGWKFAVTNGEEDLDTNSAKASMLLLELGSREGRLFKLFGKVQDGIRSEAFKAPASYAGFGVYAGRPQRVRFAFEATVDTHGLYRDYTGPITWPTSIYHRDVYDGGDPIWGYGAHVVFRRDRGPWQACLSYGEYYPDHIGLPEHDEPVKRFLLSARRAFRGDGSFYWMLILENERPDEDWQKGDRPVAAAMGVEVSF